MTAGVEREGTDRAAPNVYLFGCRYGEAGHFWWPRRMTGSSIGGPPGFPWERVDGALTPEHSSTQGAAALHHLNGWTALAFHDYLIDSRCGSNTVIAIDAEVTAEEAIALALAAFPDIAARLRTIELSEVAQWAQKNASRSYGNGSTSTRCAPASTWRR